MAMIIRVRDARSFPCRRSLHFTPIEHAPRFRIIVLLAVDRMSFFNKSRLFMRFSLLIMKKRYAMLLGQNDVLPVCR